jgi:hypothetical protein
VVTEFPMLTPIEKMLGKDDQDTERLKKMAERARNYITSFHWCLPIKAM